MNYLLQYANEALQEPIYPNPLFPPSIYYRFLKVLARHKKPRLSVELGVCGGGGSLHLALGNPRGQVVGVDIAYDHPEHLAHIDATCPNFHFWQGDSVGDASAIRMEFGLVDILFIDTTHTYAQTWAEFNAWYPHLAKGAVVCFDDLNRVEMGDIWYELPEPKIRLDQLHTGSGFGVLWI